MSRNMDISYRPLGHTGFAASIIGIGDLADRSVPLEQCVATVHRAMDCGLNLIDTAPMYEDGYSEQVVGTALRGRRDGMFVIDKIDHFDQPVATQADESLRRLELDHVDLFVMHGLSSPEDWTTAAGPGGAMEQLANCIRAGKCRYKGISSHDPQTLKLALESGLCDVVMFPVGAFVDSRYIAEVLPLARSRGVGAVCFKTFGAGKLLGDTQGYGRPLQERPRGKLSSGGAEPRVSHAHAEGDEAPLSDDATPMLPFLSVDECVHYTLTCNPDVALIGMSFPNELDAVLAALRTFRPLSDAAMTRVRLEAARAVEGKGGCWWNPQKST